VLEDGAKELPEARDRFLGHIRAQGERLTRLANSLLVLARAQSEDEQPHVELVPTRPLLEEIAAEIGAPAEVVVRVEAPVSVGVVAHRDLLYQALSNIAANARKNTHVGEVVLCSRNLGPTTEIEIRDTGRGMSPEEREHAFDRFYTSTANARGFGLGLAIAEEAVRAVSGTIAIESQPGVGTRVRIRLPSAKIVS
jgi:signal transduction histidine kinase